MAEDVADIAGAERNIAELSTSQLFRGLTPGQLREVLPLIRIRACDAGRIIYSPGEVATEVFLIRRGTVRLHRIAPGGRRVVIDMLVAGAAFGELTLASKMVYDTFAQASSDCTLFVLSRAHVERLIAAQPTVAMNLLDVFGLRLLVAGDLIERLVHPAIQSRVASLLTALLDADSEVKGLSHGDLGDRVGARRETITRVLNAFRLSGTIDLARERIRVLDVERLRAIAAAD